MLAVCTLQARLTRRREALRRPQRDERGGGILWRPPAYRFFHIIYLGVTVAAHTRLGLEMVMSIDCDHTTISGETEHSKLIDDDDDFIRIL